MKTYLTYGFGIALAGALLNLILYFAGLHNDPAKLTAAQWIGGLVGILISIVGIVLGTKARRSHVPPGESFSYGRAFVAGLGIAFFAAAFGVITGYIYMHVINPSLNDMIIQSKTAEMEAKGVNAAQLEQMEKVLRFMTSAPAQAVFTFLGGMFFGTIVSLITAAVLKREAPPPIAA